MKIMIMILRHVIGKLPGGAGETLQPLAQRLRLTQRFHLDGGPVGQHRAVFQDNDPAPNCGRIFHARPITVAMRKRRRMAAKCAGLVRRVRSCERLVEVWAIKIPNHE